MMFKRLRESCRFPRGKKAFMFLHHLFGWSLHARHDCPVHPPWSFSNDVPTYLWSLSYGLVTYSDGILVGSDRFRSDASLIEGNVFNFEARVFIRNQHRFATTMFTARPAAGGMAMAAMPARIIKILKARDQLRDFLAMPTTDVALMVTSDSKRCEAKGGRDRLRREYTPSSVGHNMPTQRATRRKLSGSYSFCEPYKVKIAPVVPRLRCCAGERPQSDTLVIDAQ